MKTFKKLEILPTTIYEYEIPDDIWEKILLLIPSVDFNEIQNRNKTPAHGKSSLGRKSLHKEVSWKFLVDHIEDKLDETAKDIGYKWIEKLKISLMWANKSDMGQWHHRHNHPWSLLSGIIYLQGLSGRTWFSRKSDYCLPNAFFLGLKDEDQESFLIHKHEIKEKTMLIFPSTLEHSVDENLMSIPRISLSFNTFPSGEVGDIDNLCGLNLNVL
jgi:uncharacterized protein (TIGR02466 family)